MTGTVREYLRSDSCVFKDTHAEWGELSNMAAGFPLLINGVEYRTLEALYQVCRFPDFPETQKLIIEQKSPMAAKMVGKPFRATQSRSDWDEVRVIVMRWCLRAKLAQSWEKFGGVLDATSDWSIVEESRRDDFWGAKPVGDDGLVGVNCLGRLLMELRDEYRQIQRADFVVASPKIGNFLLLNEKVGAIHADVSQPRNIDDDQSTGMQQLRLW